MKFFQKILVFTIVASKTLFPFLILKRPILGIFVCLVIDWLDYGLLLIANVRIDQKKWTVLYHRLDKALDQYYYTFILIYLSQNFNGPLVTTATALYIFRLIGFLLFQVTVKHEYFLYFQNIFENFSIIILLLSKLIPVNNLAVIIFAIILAIITKIPQELIVHKEELAPKTRKLTFLLANKIRPWLNLAPIKKIAENSLVP